MVIQPLFKLATVHEEELLKSWWAKPHVMEFWGNDPTKHYPKLEYFLHGGKNPDAYWTDYWITFDKDIPYCMFQTSNMRDGILPESIQYQHLATELTWSVDMLIGSEAYLGKGYAIPTLRAFTQFLKEKGVYRLMIDPEIRNTKATHVYEQVGFKTVATFQPKTGEFAAGRDHYLMVLDL